MAFRFFTLLVLLNIGTGFSQVSDSISLQNNIIKDSSKVRSTVVKDTLLDSRQAAAKTVAVDSFSIKNLKDHELAAQFDAKWHDELFNNNLYDTISKSIAELDYEPVIYTELPTDTLKARLKALNARTPFNVEYNPALESVIKSYLKNRPKTLQKLINLSAFYFPMFEAELDKHDIPLEIKYLAVVESALKPRAKSRVGATGLWQFMFTTGKMYGLNVSSYVDERSDPIMSTEAAARYLSKLYKIFGDWDLALAAYNSGPGNVTKAIRRSGGYQNYWNIRHNLPRETAGYLPAFLANMYIFEYAEEHGFKQAKPEIAYFQTDTVKVKHMITLDQVSEVTGTSIEELQFLNPSYKLDIIPYLKEEDYVLRLPLDVIGDFVNNEDEIYAYAKAEFNKREKPLPQFSKASDKITYRVKSGDYLGKISRKYGVRISDLKRWNGLRSNNIDIGQRLTIYPKRPHTSTKSATASTNKAATTKRLSGPVSTYTVKQGDSLWSISQKFSGVSVQNIIDWNGISGTKLKPGMKLKIAKG
ncbi:LysM peptidoglycan-binding domain-containing protein [Tamlana sp. s12]|uniref:lytic transglycosylase domain-containing protein n=1 Tax=Tamlana sp. s12 TaxID=1630406 RepID=UPI0007FBB4CA|nr:lytic transglycosylase domain-containing protein [Tamlana sp. s12]OBQ54918.1 murein transglycosylase [Tamlana sp. s12]QQY83025.1 LysM peptidoglycan-binding domain-containing protein [Tamlana sp. s12]